MRARPRKSTVTTTTDARHRSNPWYASLWVYVLLGMLAGILLGEFDPTIGVKMQPFGDAFIKLIRMLIAPIIFCTVVHGIARMADIARVGRVALKAIVYFEVLTTIALIIGLVAVNLWHPGRGMNVDLAHVDTSGVQMYVAHPEAVTVTSFLMNIIPSTFVGAFADGGVLPVLFISVLCAFALTQVGAAGKPVVDFIEAASRMLFAIVRLERLRSR
jgi:aerobic C4-dicarboxylate transport protein